MNGLEREYAAILDERIRLGEVERYYFEDVTLKIAHPPEAKPTRYTPDFAVYLPDGEIEYHEVKGFMEDDAAVKLKVAAEKYPHAFRLIRKRRKKDGGGWSIVEY